MIIHHLRAPVILLRDARVRRQAGARGTCSDCRLVPPTPFTAAPHLQEMARGPSLVPPSAATPSTWVKLEPLDESRFELTAPSGPDAENPDAWLAAVRNAQAQLEHTLVRQVNVDLLAKFGPAAWRRECAYLEAIADRCAQVHVYIHVERSAVIVRSLKKKLASLVEEIEGVNRDRKNEQVPAHCRECCVVVYEED